MTAEDFFNAKERISVETTVFRMLQDYDFKRKTLHIFVEADDDYSFYLKSIERIYSEFIFFKYPKNGKKFVLSSYDALDWSKYNKSRVLFFVDKDFEDFLGVSSKKDVNVFVTKYYSIENYISSKNIFQYCLEDIFKIRSTVIVNQLVSDFEESFKKFENEMILITAVILIFRGGQFHLELDKIKMEDFYFIKNLKFEAYKFKKEAVFDRIKTSYCDAFEKGKIKKGKKLDILASAGADKSKINYKLVLENVRKLKEVDDCRLFLRGKYQLWFFSKFYSNIRSANSKINAKIQEENRLTSSENTNMNNSIEINESNIFDLLPMKVETFNDVNVFLIQNRQRYNG